MAQYPRDEKRGVSRLALCALAALIALPVLAKKPVTIAFEPGAVLARVTPGASTAWFVIAQEPTGRGTKLIHGAEIIPDEDGDGVVRLALPRPTGPASIWIVVDLTSGEYAIASPAGAVLRTRLPASAWVARGNGKKARLVQKDLVGVFMLVRPGVGAWMVKIDDGSTRDGDALADGAITAPLDAMVPVGKSPAPPEDLQKDDIVLLADPLTLAIYDGWVVR